MLIEFHIRDCFPRKTCVNKLLDDTSKRRQRIHNGQVNQCSSETLALLKSEECIQSIFERPLITIYTVIKLIFFHCFQAFVDFACFFVINFNDLFDSTQECLDYFDNIFDNVTSAITEGRQNIEDIEEILNSESCNFVKIIEILNNTDLLNQEIRERKSVRYPPLLHIIEDVLRTKLDFENTKHRYSWLCSLRSRGADSQHYSGVTLLRRPPGPIVLVTAAHTTFLCKSARDEIVPNCCCENVSGKGCRNREVCGGTPSRVVEMTGEDVEVVCGEWEIGEKPYRTSGEDFNLVLNIQVRFSKLL